MTAYFHRGMTEAEQRAISATLSPAVRADLLAKGLAALPKCWDDELEACINLDPPSPNYDCQALADGWTGDFDKMEAAYNALPKCPPGAPAAGMSNGQKGLVAGGVLLLVVAVVRALRRKR